MDTSEIERRPYSYWGADGIVDLTIGGSMLLWGGLVLIGLKLPRQPSIWIPFWVLVPVGLTVLGLMQRKIVRRLKDQITAPRTGHVVLKEPSSRARVAGYAVVLLLAVVILSSILTDKGLASASVNQVIGYGEPAFLGIIFGLLGVRARRYLIPSTICFACTVVAYLRGSGLAGLLWTLVAAGLSLLALGASRLYSYLRAHPQPVAVE